MLTESELWAQVIPEPNSGCWLWEGVTDGDGYGKYKNKGAHRLSYEMFCGEIPDGQCILHSCDIRCCVNPDHLWLGTRGDNNADRASKGRSAPQDGESNNSAQLTEGQVRQIRADRRAARIAAPEYGISEFHFRRVRNGTYWKSLV